MAGRVDEQQPRDLEPLRVEDPRAQGEDSLLRDLDRADVLGDPPSLSGGADRAGDPIEQRGLSVVDVAEQRHDRLAELRHEGETAS